MTAVMVQTECPSQGPKSPPSLLKLGSPARDEDTTLSQIQVNAAAMVFDIAPETALHRLCDNIEKLNNYYAANPESTDPNSFVSTPLEGDISGDEGSSVKAVGLHCGDVEDAADRTHEETLQLALLSRKFLSKKIPPISIRDYVLRLHRYCPMSTAVLLAASHYITRMALSEKVLRVTPKNMHRLVLAGLLVATKALEDLSYPHGRVAKVGGVSEHELSKLEISFCFLANFELRVNAQMMLDEITSHNIPKEDTNV
jgi:hypothetical protein